MKNSTVLFALAISVFLLVIGQYFLAFMSFVVFVLLCTQIAGQQSIRQEDQLQKKILEEEADKNGKKATEDGTNQRMRQSLEPCIPALSIANTKGRIGMSSIHTMKGVQDLLEVFEDKVTITPKGILGFMNKGLKGTKTIPFSSITAIQFKEAGALFSGYLQFTISGGNESKGGLLSAASDENTFMFAEKKNNALAIQIKEYIEARVQELHAPRATQSQSATSLSDELQKLASLRDSGILSDQEFQSAKSRLISG